MSGRLAASAIILAGGRSHRFGSNKLAVEVDGIPLLHHVVRLAAQECMEVIIVGSPDGLPVAPPADLPSAPRVVLDTDPHEGPLVALVGGAKAASHEHDRLLLLAGDMPELTPGIMRRVLTWGPGQAGACLMSDRWPQPFPMGLARQTAITQGSSLVDAGERSLRSLVSTVALSRIPEEEWRTLDPEARSLRDIDTPGDIGR